MTKSDRPRLLNALAMNCTVLALLGGCGDGRPGMDTSRNVANISGLIKYRGKLVTDGEVHFNPSNAERQVGSSVGKIGPDGTYSVSTFTGANVVKFAGTILKEHPELAFTSRYVEAKGGENLVDFDLLSETDQVRGPTYARKTKKTVAKKP